MNKFIKEFSDKVDSINKTIDQYKAYTNDAGIPSKAFLNWGIFLANSGNIEQAVKKFEAARLGKKLKHILV